MITKIEKPVNREDLVFEANKYIYNFQKFEKIRSFTKNIFDGTITLNNADKEQIHLLIEVLEFNKNTKPRDVKKKNKKEILLKACMYFMKVEKWFF